MSTKVRNEQSTGIYLSRLANDVIKNMNLPEEVYSNEKLFLEFIKAINNGLWETATEKFGDESKAGLAPDEY